MPLDNLTELRRHVPGGKYVLARAVAERAHQLQNGDSLPLVEVKTPNPLTVAIEEIIQGKLSFTITRDTVEGNVNMKLPTAEDALLPVSDPAA